MKTFTYWLAGMLVAGSLAAQGLGGASVKGVVKDDTGAAIPGVTVTVSRTSEQAEPAVAVTGMEGDFRIADLRPGSYVVEAMLDGFQTIRREVTLVTGQSVDLAFKLVPAFGETVEVTGAAIPTGEVAILETRRQSAVVSDSISAEEIRRTPDSTAAGVVERLTGVTLIGDKYVFVRGLGERYSGTIINGSTLPTTETEKRVVPLDLFPARLLESVNIVKTYTPDKPGDFGSGLVEMTTTEFPGAAALKITIGSAYTNATGSGFRDYAGGLGRFGDGGQPIPSSIPSDILRRRTILDPNGFTAEELQGFGRALAGDWSGGPVTTAAPNTDLAVTFGRTFGNLGVVLSGVSNHGYDSVNERQSFFGVDDGELVPYNDYDLDTNRETATTGFVGNLSYRLTDSNRLSLNSVLTRDASGETRFQEGLQSGTGGNIRDYRVRYQLEEVFSSRLRGEHNLAGPGLGSLIEWSAARSTATNDSDLRESVYRETDPGIFSLETGYADSGKIEFHALDDRVEQAGVAYSAFFAAPQGNWSGTLKGGIDLMDRTRDFGARRLRFVAGSNLNLDLQATPDEIFVAGNIGPNLFEIREFTGVNDAYDARHTVDAGYLMSDVTFGKWRLIGGARYEQSEQGVTTFNPFAVEDAVESMNDSNDLLPSLNAVYQVAPRANLRFGYGRSLNRPEFRELSPFTFTEIAGGRSVSGNPELEQATLDAYDVRWEVFPNPTEVIAVSAFYKNIAKPIERIIQPTTDLRQSFVNAESAQLWGLELELRRALRQYWSVNFNYAYIHSAVTVGEHQFSVVTNTDRPLEGQSDQVGNLALQFYQPEWGTMVRLLGGYSGERLTEVGAFGLPDIYEAAYTSLDAVVSQSLAFARGLELKLGASNLLNARREFVQGGQVHRSFDPGRKISLSLSYTPF
ncbi:MAG TPA: TonB-dependent receptor [Thermoanaerobaculia bacterium]|nr:TonB-dependent receptor [Thermoanaerobaculia bacterium]